MSSDEIYDREVEEAYFRYLARVRKQLSIQDDYDSTANQSAADAICDFESQLYNEWHEGYIIGRSESIVSLIKNLGCSLDAAMDILEIPKSYYDKYAGAIRENYPDV